MQCNAMHEVYPAAFKIASLTLSAKICDSERHILASGKSGRNCSESSDFTILHLIQMESFSFGHCVGKPDLCCCLKNHPKRFADQQDVWQSPSQSEMSVGLWTRHLHFFSRTHTHIVWQNIMVLSWLMANT